MSVLTEVESAPGAAADSVFRLDEAERAALAESAEALCGIAPGLVDDDRWVAAARRLSSELPSRLRTRLRRFTWDAGTDAMLLLRNLPVDPATTPPTPSVPGSVQRAATVPAAAAMLIGMAMGEVVAFDKEKSGALVQDVVPVPGMEAFQGNAGSVRLNMHTENAFHALRPDLVGLMCLRNDHENVAKLRVASVRRIVPLLPESVRAVLHEPRFVIAAPASFDMPPGSEQPRGVLSGSVEDPDLTVDFSSTTALDDEAADALHLLEKAVERTYQDLLLAPGDLAFVDNRMALHGRSAFEPRYDGADRWLQRVFVHIDHRRSRALRPNGGQVLLSAAPTHEAPAHEAPADKAPADKAPTHEVPAGAQDTPADDTTER
ncbi:TauD/TfdA family dioxygenase [Streptomyces sp. KLOTTS4A1]|uniref:TauD/TfdA family dioxygenase n=1 Tax=Streptomyces sp. KLOTTS4A1 TaxID=3390996 RepID=UPI0039F59CD9